MPDPSDREIVAKAIAGDRQAFRQLVERHQQFVYALAYRFTGRAMDAEDITQEVFIRLWKNLARYRDDVLLTTWLYKITTNLCLDLLKSAHNKHARQTVDVAGTKMVSDSPADGPVLEEELKMAMEKFAAALSPKQKAVFILRDLEDRDMDEIAELLEMSPGQVKSNLYYARKKVSEDITLHYQSRKPVKP